MNVLRLSLVAGILMSVAFPATAAENFSDYKGCIRYAESHPKEALPEAQDWEYGSGGAAAGHCVAVALIGLKQYSKAADKLNKVAAASLGDYKLRASLYDQAGNAWMMAHKPGRAISSLTQALKLMPDDVDMRWDRSRAHAMQKDWYGAEADISHAIRMDHNRADLLSYRAKIRRNLGHKTGAAMDIVRALAIYPNYPAALVQRGNMLFEAGDVRGARKDWTRASHGKDDAAAEARSLLKKLGPPREPVKVQ